MAYILSFRVISDSQRKLFFLMLMCAAVSQSLNSYLPGGICDFRHYNLVTLILPSQYRTLTII